MSLEQAVQENTAALRELIVLLTLQNKGAVRAEMLDSAAGHGGEGATAVASAKPAAEATAEAAKPAAKATPAKTAEKPVPPVKDPLEERVWTYKELAEDFLKLVKSDKPKALAILASLGVATLKPLEHQPEFFPRIATKLAEARNG